MKRFAFHAVVLLTLAACTEPTRPAAPRSPQTDVALSVAAACPTPANVVVHDEASLHAALGAATPGEVIGLDGFFGISADVVQVLNARSPLSGSPLLRHGRVQMRHRGLVTACRRITAENRIVL
jgi:hypothetical protein